MLVSSASVLASQPSVADRSTTSSAGGGSAAYETRKAVDEYLQFHYADPADFLPYENGPQEALAFTSRLAALCERNCLALQDFTGEQPEARALDIGCAVGGASFELARAFPNVVGIDYSHQFVQAAQDMKDNGIAQYTVVQEADITETRQAAVPADIDRERVVFRQGDACNLPAMAPFDCILAANLLCRLPEPLKLLHRLPDLVADDGIAVIVSPYSWLEAWTPKSNWLGGYLKDGHPVRSEDALSDVMEKHFDMVDSDDVPFLIREHARKYQWGISHATVWRRRPRSEDSHNWFDKA
ncbi:hypothetical protein WJX72_010440 [[Myrmecia] bisecta]|uniref:Methyltransferase domain-containing protein n=1 Tax=[Myrmecia] bisecta TaxID=41462 RepID=A0AAW1QA43_9CHLO